jgi:hypothetical protein
LCRIMFIPNCKMPCSSRCRSSVLPFVLICTCIQRCLYAHSVQRTRCLQGAVRSRGACVNVYVRECVCVRRCESTLSQPCACRSVLPCYFLCPLPFHLSPRLLLRPPPEEEKPPTSSTNPILHPHLLTPATDNFINSSSSSPCYVHPVPHPHPNTPSAPLPPPP